MKSEKKRQGQKQNICLRIIIDMARDEKNKKKKLPPI